MGSRTPKILISTAYRWPTTTRLALALSDAGGTVDALCPRDHSLARVAFVSKVYHHNAFGPLDSLRDAILASKPDIIIPADDTVAAQLHELYLRKSGARDGDQLRLLIARSLGEPTNFPIFFSRAEIASLASKVGVLTPKTVNIASRNELYDQLERIGLPTVLKTDGSFGGLGVAIARTRSDAGRAFGRLNAYNGILRALKRLLIDNDPNLFVPWWRRRRPQLSVQGYLDGKRVNSAVACWKGAVLSQTCVEVICSKESTGPATVVRAISHAGMSEAVERMVGALGVSGLCGFDFILDPMDQVHLIDFNPRATQTCHLFAPEGGQPVSALVATLEDRPLPIRQELSLGQHPIVLFPHFVGHQIDGADIDQSSNSPELVKIAREYQQEQHRLLHKMFRFARSKRSKQ